MSALYVVCLAWFWQVPDQEKVSPVPASSRKILAAHWSESAKSWVRDGGLQSAEKRTLSCLLFKIWDPHKPESVGGNTTFLIEDYSTDNYCLPSGLCGTCRLALQSYGRRHFSRMLPEWYDYSAMRGFRPKRSAPDCDCQLCEMSLVRGRRGAKTSKKRKPGNPQLVGNKVTKDIKRFCGSCLTVISPGCSHKCNREQRVQNIKKLVSPTTLSRLAYESVKDDLSSNGEATLRQACFLCTFPHRRNCEFPQTWVFS